MTANTWFADPPLPSLAVTVTVASPFATPATVTALPATDTRARPGSDEAAVYDNPSPSGSEK